MTDIETKAILILQGSPARKGIPITYDISRAHAIEAICRAIEAHEATKQELADFRQEVSDMLREYIECFSTPAWHRLYEFIIPAPKPDPLREIAEAWGLHNTVAKSWVEDLRATLEARGFEIREKKDD